MKVLDVSPFQDGLRRNIAMLDRLGNEMESIHKSIKGLVAMEDVLKGEGGNAIRAFYADCHLPFLQYFKLFQGRFTTVLKQMAAALDTLEPDPSGFIQQHYLESDIAQGLRHIAQLTGNQTYATNSIMNQVADIVSLPHLDDSEVHTGIRDATIKRDDTVTQLHEFDANQTMALTSIAQDLQTMETWLADMEGLFQEGVQDINFESSQWNVLTLRSEIRTELFPKVYSNLNDLWIEKQEQLMGTMITAATIQTLAGKKVATVEENLDENVKYHMYENGLLIKEYVVDQTVFYEVVSKVEYKEESVQADKTKGSKVLDYIQTGLDIVGLVPVFGEAADGVNGVIYAARGDALNAGLSFGAMIPIAGWVGTGGKLVVKGKELNQVKNVVSTEKMASIYSPIYQDVVNSPLGKTQNQLDFLSNTHSQLGTPNAFTFNMPFGKTDIPTSIKSGDVNVDIKKADVGDTGTGNVPKGYYQDANGSWHRPDGEYASNKELGLPEPTGISRRSEYMGATPGKSSRTGKEVIERMKNENPPKIRTTRNGRTEFVGSDGKWYPLNEADMAHLTDAVSWWNSTGKQYGAKSPEVREWMLDSNNYVLDHYSLNRSAGGALTETYLPPTK